MLNPSSFFAHPSSSSLFPLLSSSQVGNRKLMAMKSVALPPSVEAFLEAAEEQAQTGGQECRVAGWDEMG